MPITTPRLIIRPPELTDTQNVHSAILESFEELHRFMPWAKEKQSIEATEQFIKEALANWILQRNEEPFLPLLIIDTNTKKFIGATGYQHFNWDIPCLETGYWIRSSRSGEGLMTEAINALSHYAFKQLGVKRIAITCDEDNNRSKKIPERLGYNLEGILKANRVNILNEVTNTCVFACYSIDSLPSLDVSW